MADFAGKWVMLIVILGFVVCLAMRAWEDHIKRKP